MPVPHHSILKQLPPFARLSEIEITEVLQSAVPRRYPAGSVVFEQGAAALHFSVLLNGRLRVTQVTPTGEQVVVRIVNPGDIFGIARALRLHTYPGTATAVVESLALSWPMEQWEPLVERYPSFAASAIRVIGERLLEAQSRIREISTEVVERRVGHTVLRLVQQSGVREAEGIRIDFPISKQDLAEMAGTTLHTVSRILTAWEHAGLVDTGRQKLMVKDPHRLLLVADGIEPGLLG
ncbi:MAG: Crp/Fnr family transcriptional regulator [Kaistia sp. SCN 65-12]|jgi:CRP-like cAMP-binding protein|nr:MAG: Crp/Fnr family transcriptional regulator [Kaistia sp. SCN 65-12]